MFYRIAVIAVFGLLITINASAQWRQFVYPKDTTIEVNGNKLLLAGHVDTIEAVDPITSGVQLSLDYDGYRSRNDGNKVILNRVPVQLNGEQIYSPYGNANLEYCAKLAKGKRYLAEHIQKKTRWQYKRLSKAAYNADIRNIVVNKEGRVVYYEYNGLYKTDGFNRQQLSARYLGRVNKKLRTLMDKLYMKPAMLNGKPVAYRLKHYELL